MGKKKKERKRAVLVPRDRAERQASPQYQSKFLVTSHRDLSIFVWKDIYWKVTGGCRKPMVMGEPGFKNEKKLSTSTQPRQASFISHSLLLLEVSLRCPSLLRFKVPGRSTWRGQQVLSLHLQPRCGERHHQTLGFL